MNREMRSCKRGLHLIKRQAGKKIHTLLSRLVLLVIGIHEISMVHFMRHVFYPQLLFQISKIEAISPAKGRTV